jgi:hypothetical protein
LTLAGALILVDVGGSRRVTVDTSSIDGRGGTHKLIDETRTDQRKYERVNTLAEVWVSWTIGGRTLVSPVTDLGLGGLFIATPNPESVEARVQLKFVVKEGEIRAVGSVRYIKPGKGMGVQFTALADGGMSRLHRLVQRIGMSSSLAE